MQSNKLRWLVYLTILSFFSMISYTMLSYRSSNFERISTSVREEIVYKEKDVLSLLKKIEKLALIDTNNKSITQQSVIENTQDDKNNEITTDFRHDYLKKYPNFMNCRRSTLKKWSADLPSVNPKPDYSKQAPKETHNVEFMRAVLLYFPIEQVDNFMLEFKWLYRSWIEMQKYEPKKWRTDLIVFIENDPTFFKKENFLNQLGCKFTNRRKSTVDKPMCTLINYVALKKRDLPPSKRAQTPEDIKAKYDYLLSDLDIFSDDKKNLEPFYSISKEGLSNYGYVDSIMMAFDGYEYFKTAGYDFLIRSDMDVFLTPLFAKWLPDNCNDFYVGRGGYSDDFNRKRLGRIASDLGLKYAGGDNLGSTWYSTPEQFRLVSYLTIFSMTYLSQEEFSKPEREGKLGVELWPYWHYGVLLLYGQNIGLNHLMGSKQLNVVKLENLIDYPSANTEDVNTKLHIHVFHGDDLFSKFAYKMGKYDQMEVNDSDTSKVKYYALKMALSAKRLKTEDLKQMFDDQVDTLVN